MLEFLTGSGLAAAAGLNAYIPLLALGLLGKFAPQIITLPPAWAWLSNDWVLIVLGVLLVFEIVADKIPGLDSVNDWIQTIVRPAAGGIVFGTGSASQTATVTDPAQFFSSNAWVPVVVGVVMALIVHLLKTTTRPVANAASFGIAAPVLSTVEDGSSIVLSVVAIFIPLLVIIAIGGVVTGFVALILRARRKARRDARAADVPDIPAPGTL